MTGKWRRIVETVSTDCTFAPPASAEGIARAERALGQRIPPDLRELLLECNGIEGEYGLGVLWPVERIVRDNLAYRSDAGLGPVFMPFDHLLFFGDAGNGDQFAFAVMADGQVRHSLVYVWNHEDDSRSCIAPSLASYLEGWLSGHIAV